MFWPKFLSQFHWIIFLHCLIYTPIFGLNLPADIVFDYRQKATRSFEYLQGDYYIAPVFMVQYILAFMSTFLGSFLN